MHLTVYFHSSSQCKYLCIVHELQDGIAKLAAPPSLLTAATRSEFSSSTGSSSVASLPTHFAVILSDIYCMWIRCVIIPEFRTWIRIRSWIFRFVALPDPDLDTVKSEIITPREVTWFRAWFQIWSRIFSLWAILNLDSDLDSDPVKSGIVTALMCICTISFQGIMSGASSAGPTSSGPAPSPQPAAIGGERLLMGW